MYNPLLILFIYNIYHLKIMILIYIYIYIYISSLPFIKNLNILNVLLNKLLEFL